MIVWFDKYVIQAIILHFIVNFLTFLLDFALFVNMLHTSCLTNTVVDIDLHFVAENKCLQC